MTSSLIRLLCAVGFCAVLLTPASAKKAPPTPSPEDDYDTVVALSPFEVKARSMEFSQWQKLSSPHFILYTDAKPKEAALLIKHMEMVHQAAQFYLRRKSLNLPAMILVLPTGRSDWRKIANKGGVEWEVATSIVGSARPVLLVQYNWQGDGLAPVWGLVGWQEITWMNLEGPLWFQHGVSGFFETAEFDGDTLTLGKQGFDAYWLKKHGWLDWPKFFKITNQSPEYTGRGPGHLQFMGQAAVFAHFLLTNKDPAWTPRLLAWSAYLQAGNEPTEQSFKDLFQHDFNGWESELKSMLNGGTYTTGIIRFPPAALQFKVDSTTPSAREMRELFVLSQILNQATKESEASLDAVLARGIKTDSLRELLADACGRRKRPEMQLRELRALIAAGSTNPVVYADAAKVLFQQQVKSITLDARLGVEAEEIRTWCTRARELEPRHLDSSELLAWTEALADKVEKRNVDVIAAICRALDGHARTDNALAALAMARWRSGAEKQARGLAERLMASPFSGKPAREIATQLLARLDASAAPAASVDTAAGAPQSR